MKYGDVKLHALPHVEAYCKSKECAIELVEISNGLLARALYCPKCSAVYTIHIKKLRADRVNKEYLKELKEKHGKR